MAMRTIVKTASIALIGALCLGAVACSGGDSAEDGQTVEVSMRDWDLIVSPETVAPGEVTFQATNEGPTTHEFEIFSGADGVDLASLPIEDDVADVQGLVLLDEVENVTASATAELAVTLEPGTYAIVCNLPEHFAQGMYSTLTVE